MLAFLNNLWGLGTELEQVIVYRPTRLHSLAELVPWNRFVGSFKVKNSGSVLLPTTLEQKNMLLKNASAGKQTDDLCLQLFPFLLLRYVYLIYRI